MIPPLAFLQVEPLAALEARPTIVSRMSLARRRVIGVAQNASRWCSAAKQHAFSAGTRNATTGPAPRAIALFLPANLRASSAELLEEEARMVDAAAVVYWIVEVEVGRAVQQTQEWGRGVREGSVGAETRT